MASISSPCFDVVEAGIDSTDVVGQDDTVCPEVDGRSSADSHILAQAGTDSSDVAGRGLADFPERIGHELTESMDVSVILSTSDVVHPDREVLVHQSADPESVLHESIMDTIDHKKISATIAVDLDHAYTESTGGSHRAQAAATDMVHQTPVASPDSTEVDVSEAASHTEAPEHADTACADLGDHGDTAPVSGLESISSTNIVDSAYTDTVDVADNVVAYSTSVVDGADTCISNVIPQASTDKANTDPTENQADTDSKDDIAVHASSSRIDSAVKKSHISRGSSQASHQRIPTPVTVKEVGSPLPDFTPSRRSSRKKQSTFSSDFEYYALGNMKIEIKPEPTLPSKPRQARSEAQDDDINGSSESDEDMDDDKTKNVTKKKIAEKKHRGKVSEAGDSEEDDSDEEVKSDKGKVKVADKKKTPKLSTIIKGSKKKKIKMEKEESETGEDSGADMNENRVTPKLLKGHKRKKDDGFAKVSKKMKLESDQEDESSDEEESTPISLLKAKLKEESTPISQLKDKLKEESIPISKLKAELKEESIPISKLKAKLKDADPFTQRKKDASNSASPAKIKSAEELDAFSLLQAQIRLKRVVEKKATSSSSQGRSLMERLADGSLDLSVDYDGSPFQSQKRKLMLSEDTTTDEIPSKISKSIRIDKLAPALVNLVKLLPGNGQVKAKSSNMARPETAAPKNNTGSTKTHPSSHGSSGPNHKHKVKHAGSLLKRSEKGILEKTGVGKSDRMKGHSPKPPKMGVGRSDQMKGHSPKPPKTGVGRSDQMKGHSPKSPKEMKPAGDGVKKEVRYITKVKVIRKPDGTIIKKKVMVPERVIHKLEEDKIKKQYSPEKSERKKVTKTENTKTDTQRKHAVASGHTSPMKHNGRLDNDGFQKKKSHESPSNDGSGLKHKHGLKVKAEHDRKDDRPSLTVEDLLKRGIFHKKKRHQPFGNKNLPKPSVKDLKSETVRDATKMEHDDKESKGNKERTYSKGHKSSYVDKQRRDRSRSSESSKSRRRSKEAGKKKLDKQAEAEEDDSPPVLIPASSLGKPKHRHHKVEQEVPVDITMNDLFKPDTHAQDLLNKEVMQDKDKSCGSNDKSENSVDTQDVQSGVEPDRVYSILIDHQYSKPASPVMPSQDGQGVDSVVGGGDDDIESISHAKAVVMDANLPDQFLEESDELATNDTENFQDTWPATMEELQHMVERRDTADRASILESLGSELQESGTEFLIVGQVEVGRVPALLREERQSTQDASRSDSGVESEKADGASTGERKSSVDRRKQSIEKSRDDTDRRTALTGSERKSSTKDNKYSSEDRRSSSDKKVSADYKKSGSEDKKKNSLDNKKSYSSDDRRKSSSGENKKVGSESKKSSTSDQKASHEDKRKKAYDRSDGVDKKKYKDSKKPDSTEPKPEDDEEMGDNSGEEPNFEDDDKDIDWEPNDTDTLYCICRKPHNNRFMICCDKCEEWFHGTCVGVSRARGKEMEDNEEEYICPFCAKGDPDLTLETAVQSLTSPEKMKSQLLQKCVRRKCSKVPRPGSVYCSNECVMSHAQEALKTIREEQVKKKISEKQPSTQSKHSSSSTTKTAPAKSSSSADTVEVIERETGKLLTGSSAPTQKGLHRWLEQHPTFEVVLPHKHRSKSSSSKDKKSRSDRDKTSSADRDRQKSDKDRKRAETDKRDQTSSKDSSRQAEAEKPQNVNSQTSDGSRIDDRRGDGQKQIRVNVQTALSDCLSARAQEADDIMLSSNEIKSLALTIEEELFSLFNDTGHKYRTKYRSLVFNIKDQKNKGLFRKILTGKIKPHKLVQMSTEELASKELAMWREQASKHQLDMIQKTEQQALKESAAAKHVRKKTHKGEVEVEEEDLSILETRLEEKKDPEPELQEELPQLPVIDTTEQHRAHLFDLNCKVCTGKIVPGREEQVVKAAPEKPAAVTFEQPEEIKAMQSHEEKEDYEKAEEIVKEAFRTMQKMEKSVSSLPKIVSSSPAVESATPPLSPKLASSRRDSSSSSASSMSSSSARRTVVVRSPDSALQSGLEARSKFTPTGPMLWKGFMSMLDVAKFFTSAYRVSGPTDHIIIPDTINILGRISPEHMWDYLSKIRQAGSKDLTVVRFIPGNDDQKVAYIHLYSYLNSRSRCGVAASTNKQIKDFYIIPLASHSKIPRTLLPFDGPGLEENRPHMLIGVLVRQRGKLATDTPDAASVGKSGTPSTSTKSGSQSTSVSKSGSHSSSSSSSSGKPGGHRSTASSSTKLVTPVVSRDPRLAKLAAREASPKVSPAESSIYVTSTSADTTEAPVEEYEPEYVPMPVNAKNAYKPVAEYIPTPTVKKTPVEKEMFVERKERMPSARDVSDKNSKARKEKYRYHHEKKVEKKEESEDDSDPYSPGKEAEPYSPGQEAAADEPYDPADGSLINETDVPVISSMTVSSSTVSTSGQPPAAATEHPPADVAAHSLAVVEPPVASVVHTDTKVNTLELIEKMAHSNDPQEISAFMVTALSATSSALEQQKMLVELTSKVEERKLQLAETARSGREEDDIHTFEDEKLKAGGVSSSLMAAGDASQIPQVSQGATPFGDSDASTNLHVSVNVESFTEQTVSSSLLPPPSLPASLSTCVIAPEFESSEVEPKLPLETSLTAQSQDVDKSAATVSTPAAAVESSGDIPDALKALINDVMGNTQVSSSEMRRRMALKTEVQKVDVSAKEVLKEDKDSSESQLLDMQAEAQKRLMDEAEALKILQTVKQLEQVASGVQVEHPSSSSCLSGDGCVTGAAAGGNEFVPEVEDTKKEAPSIAPSIDALLEKLKSGGFQFPAQKADSGPSSSVLSTLVQPSGAIHSTSSTVCHPELPATASPALPSVAPTTVSSSAAASSGLSSASALDLDLRQKKDFPGSSSKPAVSSSSGSVDSKPADYRKYSSRLPSTFPDQDDTTFYQDRDDRLPRPSAAPVPKHPLDPRAFPPLPGKSPTYPPPARSNLPLGPLHPRFPLPCTDSPASYDPTPLGPHPKARGQHHPPGTESEKPPAGSRLMDDLSATDVDFRSQGRAAGFQDRLSPPLPVQPQPPLSAVPENSGSKSSSQAPADVDLRGRDPRRPPHSRYTGHHGRGGDRPYQRH